MVFWELQLIPCMLGGLSTLRGGKYKLLSSKNDSTWFFPCLSLAWSSFFIHWKLCRSLELALCVVLSHPGPYPVNSSGCSLFKRWSASSQLRVIAGLCYVPENIIYSPGRKLQETSLFPFSEGLVFCATCLISENCCVIYFP